MWMMKNLACFLLVGVSLFTLFVRWVGPGGCCVFSALVRGSSRQLSLLLFPSVVPASVTWLVSLRALLHPEHPTAPPLMECRNCLGKLALKTLTCLLLSSLLHINAFVSLSLPQFGAEMQSPPGFSGNLLKSKRAFLFSPHSAVCHLVYPCFLLRLFPEILIFTRRVCFWPRSLQRLLLISALWLGPAHVNVQQTNAA